MVRFLVSLSNPEMQSAFVTAIKLLKPALKNVFLY